MEEVGRTSERFDKSRRLLKRSEFLRVQRCAAGVRGRWTTLLVYLRGDEGPARLGVVASKKMGHAPDRNRGKRRVREWFRKLGDRDPKGADIVVILRPGAGDAPWSELSAELDKSLARGVAKANKARAARSRA